MTTKLSTLLLILLVLLMGAQNGEAQNGGLGTGGTLNAQLSYVPSLPSSNSTVINISAGSANCAGTIVTYQGGTLPLASNATNYVFLDTSASCVPTVNTTGFPATGMTIAIVPTASNGQIVNARDLRQIVGAQSTGSGGAGAITSVFGRTGVVAAIAGDYNLSQLSGGVAQVGVAFDFSNVILVLPSSNGYTSNAVGRCGYDTATTNWHCWDGADAIVALLAPGTTPITGDVATWINNSGNINLSASTPVGGGTSFLKVSGVSGALNGDFVHQDNTGVWRAVTPGVPGRTATTATEPLTWASGTGDRGGQVSLTNASLVTSAIPQCGVAPAVSNPYTVVWITGAGGAKFTSTTSALNGIAGATGITYPGNTYVNVTCPDNANYTLLASRAFKSGSGLLETLNNDGTVTGSITSHSASLVLTCSAASASGTAYTCTTAPTFVPASGDAILFKADVANTGAVTLNVNASSAAPVKKQGGGTALVANDFLASQSTLLIYDGTNWQMQGQIGNAAGGTSVWSALTAPAGNLSLTMGTNLSTFNYATALAQNFSWKNTTAAIVGTSQGSPVPALCGRAWTGSDVEDCLTFQDVPGNGVNAPITFLFAHTGTSTGQVDSTFPGPVKSGGSTAGFGTYAQGSTSTGIEPCNAVNTICEQAPAAVTTYSITKPGAAPTIASYKQTDTCGSLNCTETFHPVPVVLRVTADFTDASSTALQNITGLGFTFPANQALNAKMDCDILYDQTVAAVSDAWGVQDVSVAPTNIEATGFTQTAATTWAEQQLLTLSTTTATNVGTFTPSAITTVWHAQLHFLIEHPSNASTSALNVMVSQSTAADLIVIKRGSACMVTFQ